MKNRKIFGALSAFLLVGLLAAPASAHHKDGHEQGGQDQAGQCEGFNDAAKKRDNPGDFDHGVATWTGVPGDDGETYTVVGTLAGGGSITFVVKDGDTVVTGALVEFCLKAGSGNQEGPQYFRGDTAAAEGTHPRGSISNVVVYRVIIPKDDGDPDELGQWCSPGFWRNSPIQAAAVAAGADLSFLPTGVTYLQVLNSPQTFGGGLFNQVGDALSTAHAGVDFQGHRVEGSCPLSADASTKAPGRKK